MLKPDDLLWIVQRPKAKPKPKPSYDRAILFGVIVMMLSLLGFYMGWHPHWLVEFLSPSH